MELKPTDLPIEMSADGKNNAFTHSCDITGNRPYYAACLRTVRAYEAGEPNSLYRECNLAIENRMCPAVLMREDEMKAGKAIFFRQRQRSGFMTSVVQAAENFFQYRREERTSWSTTPSRGVSVVRPMRRPGPKKTTSEKLFSSMGDHGFEKAVNRAVEKDTKKREVRPGETPLDAAKRWLSE